MTGKQIAATGLILILLAGVAYQRKQLMQAQKELAKVRGEGQIAATALKELMAVN